MKIGICDIDFIKVSIVDFDAFFLLGLIKNASKEMLRNRVNVSTIKVVYD
jgi:hypothetical protein